jgi:hypothetical protein
VAIFGSLACEDASAGVMLLGDIRSVFEEQRDSENISSTDLVAALCKMDGRPWAEWSNGKGMNPNRLAKQLRKYEVFPRTIRIGNTTAKGYSRSFFAEAWSRYCTHSSVAVVTDVTACIAIDESSTSHPSQIAGVSFSPFDEKPRQFRNVTRVTAVTAVQRPRALERIVEGCL